MQQLSRPARRAVLVVHVAVSVSWLGLTLGLLTLGITGHTTGSPEMTTVAYRAMKIFGDWLVLPIAFASLVSGLVVSLGTAWGLARHRWVVVKFWLTLVTVLLSVFSLRPGINHLAAEAAAGTPAPDISLVVAPHGRHGHLSLRHRDLRPQALGADRTRQPTARGTVGRGPRRPGTKERHQGRERPLAEGGAGVSRGRPRLSLR